MISSFNQVFYKGPITSCEYLNDNKILIGYGPYLSLIDESSFEEISKHLALRYRIIHKIVINKQNPEQICIFGQKAFNIVTINEKNEFKNLFDSYIELDDWIFDIYWLDLTNQYLVIVLAHNQCLLFNLNEKKVEFFFNCDQKCMLYSAKIIDLNKENSNKLIENIFVASGTIYNEVLLWSILNGHILLNLKGHQGVIFNLEYSYKNNYLFSTSDDRSINVWSLKSVTNDKTATTSILSGDLYTRFYGHDARVWKCISFMKGDIQYLTSVGEDLNCCLWNVNDKVLIYRFDAKNKGSKNIWSMSVNIDKMQIITGWADGGLRKFELNHYLKKQEEQIEQEISSDNFEWNLVCENEKDFIRNLTILNGRIICCTNLGSLYMINTSTNTNESKQNQKLLFKSILLSNFSVMSKNLLDKASQHWCLAIGTLKGFVYLLNIKFADKNSNKTDEITIDCINCLGIEEELTESNASTSSAKTSLQTIGASKIFNITWFKYKRRNFLLVCFSLMNGLVHLYEFHNSNQLDLIARLYLPVCKHRWVSAYSIISIKNINLNDDSTDSNVSDNFLELIYLIAGDKCGNLHLYKIELNKKGKINSDSDELNEQESQNINLKLIKPLQTISGLTKESSPISAIYSKNVNQNESENDENLNYLIICCCKDGFYRVFEFDSSYFNDYEETDEDQIIKKDENSEAKSFSSQITKSMLKLINKYQINSNIDLIEYFIFENDDNEENSILKKFKSEKELSNMSDISVFDLENNLKLALCFYGDKFILWNFHLNRSLFESKCGGANRSWDYEFTNPINNTNDNSDTILFRFTHIKNKSIAESKKLLSKNEIERPFAHTKNHLCQIFHGNTITTCKFLYSSKYLLTGSEDTQLIVSKLENTEPLNLIHQFHLHGHDSVVKCVGYMQINEFELLLVSAGGKANIKLWKIILNENINENESITINRIIHLCEFKRKINRSKKLDSTNASGKSEKPWLYIDLKTNPDIRFMDVCVFKSEQLNDTIICFACSDGFIRIFRYNIDTNKLYLVNKYEHPKCLLCIRNVNIKSTTGLKSYLLSFGTDGSLLFWKVNLIDEERPQKLENLNQSGINDVDLWRENDSNRITVATVGDDTGISLVEIEIDNEKENFKQISPKIRLDMAHASAIIGVRFLNRDFISTVSKDQRLVVWKVDYNSGQIKPVKVLFINVADVSSMDLVRFEEQSLFRFSLVGVGMEIVHFKLA